MESMKIWLYKCAAKHDLEDLEIRMENYATLKTVNQIKEQMQQFVQYDDFVELNKDHELLKTDLQYMCSKEEVEKQI